MADKIAGIDVHKKVLMVVAMDARTPESKPERRRCRPSLAAVCVGSAGALAAPQKTFGLCGN
jgi:hypothetical protein